MTQRRHPSAIDATFVISIIGMIACAVIYFVTEIDFLVPMAWGFAASAFFSWGYAMGRRGRD